MAGRSRTNVPATIYKDFQPQIERKAEQEANTLIIHLPDFPKEQINVTYVDSSRSIKIQAERAVERNTRSRFNAAFPVSENCIIEKIQGSFRNGVLTITMPKRIINQLPLESPKQVNVPKQTTPSKSNTPKPAAPAPASTSAVEKQKDKKVESSQSPPKPKTEPKPPMASTSTSAVEKQKDKKVESFQSPPKPKTEPKPPMATAPQTVPSPKDQQNKGKKVEALPPVKQQEEIQRKVSPIAKQIEEKTVGSTSTLTRPQVVEKKGETKEGLRDIVKDSIPEPEAKIPKTSEKAGVEKKPKEGGGGGFLAKAKEMKGVNTIMKSVKKLATDDQEDRQLLINIGVSVLVIVALGAYITYTYRSSGKNKN